MNTYSLPLLNPTRASSLAARHAIARLRASRDCAVTYAINAPLPVSVILPPSASELACNAAHLRLAYRAA